MSEDIPGNNVGSSVVREVLASVIRGNLLPVKHKPNKWEKLTSWMEQFPDEQLSRC